MNEVIGITYPSTHTEELVEAIELHGGNPVILTPLKRDNLEYWIDQCAAIVMGGGVDIHPSIYGKNVIKNANLSRFDLRRDKKEIEIINMALKKNKYILGICRAHQLFGAMFGLNIRQDISGYSIKHGYFEEIVLSKDEPAHSVNTAGGLIWVNSFHHQAVLLPEDKKKPKNLFIYGTCVLGSDKTEIEIVEWMGGEGWESVQWHPEVCPEMPSNQMIWERFWGNVR